MGLFSNLFGKSSEKKYPEDYFEITINEEFVMVEHPKRKTEKVLWKNIEEIRLINTDDGPFFPDIWLVLMGKEDGCLIPSGTEGFEKVYDIVTKYEGFDFNAFIEAMGCNENKQFFLWKKKSDR